MTGLERFIAFSSVRRSGNTLLTEADQFDLVPRFGKNSVTFSFMPRSTLGLVVSGELLSSVVDSHRWGYRFLARKTSTITLIAPLFLYTDLQSS